MPNKIVDITGKNADGNDPQMPPTPIMIQQIWLNLQSFAGALNNFHFMMKTILSAMNEIQHSELETHILLRTFAKEMDHTLPSQEEIAKVITDARIEWLKLMLENKDGKLNEQQLEAVTKELEQLEKVDDTEAAPDTDGEGSTGSSQENVD